MVRTAGSKLGEPPSSALASYTPAVEIISQQGPVEAGEEVITREDTRPILPPGNNPAGASTAHSTLFQCLALGSRLENHGNSWP